jgi:hypothetical protein
MISLHSQEQHHLSFFSNDKIFILFRFVLSFKTTKRKVQATEKAVLK